MSMIQAITSTVDVLLAWCVVAIIVAPYIVSVMKTDPNDSPLAAMGEVYYDLFYIGIKYHLVEVLGICAVLFFLAAAFHTVAAVLCIWAFQAACLIYLSIKKGYHPAG